MQSYLELLDRNLRLLKTEIQEGTIHLYCESKPRENQKIHSRVERVVKDLNFGDYKVELHINWKKYFINSQGRKTKSEIFDFVAYRGRRTKRLDQYLIDSQKEMTAIGCERYIKKHVANVSDSTILRILKKNKHNAEKKWQ